MSPFSRETLLAKPVLKYLRGEGFVHLGTELPFYEYRIDVYGYSGGRDLSVAVELKLTKWRSAVRQALLYQLCADMALLAMPRRVTHRIDLDLLRSYGIGLIEVDDDGSCSLRLAPTTSGVVRAHYRHAYAEMVGGKAPCQQ